MGKRLCKFLTVCATVLACALTAPASATPDGMIDIEDQAFGLSEEEVFVLRTVTDNMGSYYERRVETFLVAISLTSDEQTSWHLASLEQSTEFAQEGGEDQRTLEYLPIENRADPFAILSKRGGVVWAGVGKLRTETQPERQESETGDVVFAYPGGLQSSISLEIARSYTENAAQQVARDMPDYRRNHPISAADLVTARLEYPPPCTYVAQDVALKPLTLGRVQLIELTCAHDPDGEHTQLLVPAANVLVSRDQD